MHIGPTELAGIKLCPDCAMRLAGVRELTIRDVMDAVAAATGVSVNELRSARQNYRACAARRLAMALAYRLTPHNSNTIGRVFGGRVGSTVRQVKLRLTPVLDALGAQLGEGAPVEAWVSACINHPDSDPYLKPTGGN